MEQKSNPETELQAAHPQESTSMQNSTNVLRRHIKEDPMKEKLAKYRLWMNSMPHEYPMPYTPYKIGVYIRYYNQTRYENYLEKHLQQFMDDIALCPQWTLVDFYVDEGQTAPHMEYSKEWCRLLEDCFTGKVDLIVTQKISNVSSDWHEMAFMARMLAAQEHPIGIYFISEDIFTLASYYQSDLRDEGLFPAGWQMLPPDELDEPMLSTMKKPALLEQAEQMTLDDSEGRE
jgi:hypothetical protein